MSYSPRDIADWNLKELLRHLRLQGVEKEELRDALLAAMEGLK